MNSLWLRIDFVCVLLLFKVDVARGASIPKVTSSGSESMPKVTSSEDDKENVSVNTAATAATSSDAAAAKSQLQAAVNIIHDS